MKHLNMFRFRILFFIVTQLCLLGFLNTPNKVYAAEFSTGYHPPVVVEYYLPSNGWTGNPENIKINDNIPFTTIPNKRRFATFKWGIAGSYRSEGIPVVYGIV